MIKARSRAIRASKTAEMAKATVLIVGGFPPKDSPIKGGIVTSCQNLMATDFPLRFDVIPFDTTQRSNPPPPFRKRLIGALARTCRFVVTLLKHRPDITIIFTSSGASLLEKGLMSWMSWAIGVPVLLFPRSGRIMEDFDRSRMAHLAIRFAFSPARRVLCQGQTWARFVIERLGRLEQDVEIVPNWTASRPYLDLCRNRKPLLQRAHLRLLFLGWLEERKGIINLIDAIAVLKADGLKPHLSIAGDGHARDAVQARITHHGLGDQVTLLGWVQDDQKLKLLSDHTALVLPSWSEGLPNAMIEAMAAGCVVVVSRVGNIPDYIEDGRNGLLHAPRDSADIARALRQLMATDTVLQPLSKAGHDTAAQFFSPQVAARRLTDIVTDIITHGTDRGQKEVFHTHAD